MLEVRRGLYGGHVTLLSRRGENEEELLKSDTAPLPLPLPSTLTHSFPLFSLLSPCLLLPPYVLFPSSFLASPYLLHLSSPSLLPSISLFPLPLLRSSSLSFFILPSHLFFSPYPSFSPSSLFSYLSLRPFPLPFFTFLFIPVLSSTFRPFSFLPFMLSHFSLLLLPLPLLPSFLPFLLLYSSSPSSSPPSPFYLPFIL